MTWTINDVYQCQRSPRLYFLVNLLDLGSWILRLRWLLYEGEIKACCQCQSKEEHQCPFFLRRKSASPIPDGSFAMWVTNRGDWKYVQGHEPCPLLGIRVVCMGTARDDSSRPQTTSCICSRQTILMCYQCKSKKRHQVNASRSANIGPDPMALFPDAYIALPCGPATRKYW